VSLAVVQLNFVHKVRPRPP